MILMTGLETQPSAMDLVGLRETPGQCHLVDPSELVVNIPSQKMAGLPAYLPG
jgi:hypothetical protein